MFVCVFFSIQSFCVPPCTGTRTRAGRDNLFSIIRRQVWIAGRGVRSLSVALTEVLSELLSLFTDSFLYMESGDRGNITNNFTFSLSLVTQCVLVCFLSLLFFFFFVIVVFLDFINLLFFVVVLCIVFVSYLFVCMFSIVFFSSERGRGQLYFAFRSHENVMTGSTELTK